MSCQTCASDIVSAPGFVPPCCNVPICAACVARNPRLTAWVPCLRCGSSSTPKEDEIVVGGRVKRTEVRKEDAGKTNRGGRGEEEQFALGDESDGDERDEDSGGDGKQGQEGGENGQEQGDGEPGDDEDEQELVEIKHTVSRGDTLLSIARKYAADPHDLLKLNNLPYAALHTNPSLVRTRRELVVARRLLRNGEDLVDTPQRRAERALRRFQAVSKAEEGVARAYLALNEAGEDAVRTDGSELGDSLVLVDVKDGQVEQDVARRGVLEEKKQQFSGPEAALEHFFDDEVWEANAPSPSRGRVGRWRAVGAVLPDGVKAE